MRGLARQVLMIDPTGKSDTFVIPHNANAQQVADLWRRVIEALDDIGISVSTGNGEVFHWAYVTTKETISYTFRTPSMRCDVGIYVGKTQFEADQISRLLDIKVPPLVKSHKTPRPHAGPLVQFDEDVVPLGLRIIGTHIFSWNLESTILRDTQPMDLWVPYDLGLIMRRGHDVNTAIPEDPAEAEFPELPWKDEVMIRIKSQKPPPAASIPTPAHDPPKPFTPPVTWQGPALGQAPSISPDAAALTGYTSQNTGQDGTTLGGLPPDPELLRFRGQSETDNAVHRMISWTTRKDYPLMVGVSLPVAHQSFDGAHDAQLWEEVGTELIIDGNHAEVMYSWLKDRFSSRSTQRFLPVGMPEAVTEVSISTRR